MKLSEFRRRRAELKQAWADRGENHGIDSAEVTSATYTLLYISAGVRDCHPGEIPRTMLIDGILVAERTDSSLALGRIIFWTANNFRYTTKEDGEPGFYIGTESLGGKNPIHNRVTTKPKESETMEKNLYEYRIVREEAATQTRSSAEAQEKAQADPEELTSGEVWAISDGDAMRRVLFETDPKIGKFDEIRTLIRPFCG